MIPIISKLPFHPGVESCFFGVFSQFLRFFWVDDTKRAGEAADGLADRFPRFDGSEYGHVAEEGVFDSKLSKI
jgi:hypothetical protein